MPKYAYVASGPDGAEVSGVIKGADLSGAREILRSQGLDVRKVHEKASKLNVELSPARVKREELMHISRQLAAFVRAGITILDGIRVLGEESDSKAVRTLMEELHADLRAGMTLADAIDKHPKTFPEFYRGILRSAELTGQLDTVLERLSSYLERDLEARRKIKAALIYPTVVAATSLVTILVLSLFVLPKFKDFFASLDAELPLPTRMLLGLTDFLGTWWWALVSGFLLVVLILVGITRTTRGRLARDTMLLKVPVLGETIRYALVERFCRVFASMVSAGVTLPEAMRVASDSMKNVVFVNALGHARTQMIQGDGIAGPMALTQLFPGTAIQMMRVGEDTGTLDAQLEVAAQYYEKELDYKVKRLTTLFEPAVILVMGGVVGFVAIALVSAMYGIFRQVQV